MKEYRIKRSTLAFTLGFLVVLTLVTGFGLFFAEPRWFFAAMLLVLLWEWNRHLRAPVEVRVADGGAIEFRSLIGHSEVDPSEIQRVRRAGRYCSIEHGGRTTNLYANMDGLEEFLSHLQAANPNLEVTRFTWGQKR
ncbi:MAG: hypothetical protein PVI01_17590 [Gemmatimonadales bacterium]|jgi:hypothetical protein